MLTYYLLKKLKRKTLLIILAIVAALHVEAQSVRRVQGECTYPVPENVSIEDARRTALERAMIQALADEFGTTVSQTNMTNVGNANGKSVVDFHSVGMSEVKGEWLETIGKPVYEESIENNVLVVKVSVKGKAREIANNKIDLDVHLLKNGKDKRFEANAFADGDKVYLSFQSPVDGFLAVYLVDDSEKAYCLLPYPRQNGEAMRIKANAPYLLFDRSTAPQEEANEVEEYYLTSQQPLEHNQAFVIFSPNKFSKAVDNRRSDFLPRELGTKKFYKWLTQCRQKDIDMQLIRIPITIKNE